MSKERMKNVLAFVLYALGAATFFILGMVFHVTMVGLMSLPFLMVACLKGYTIDVERTLNKTRGESRRSVRHTAPDESSMWDIFGE